MSSRAGRGTPPGEFSSRSGKARDVDAAQSIPAAERWTVSDNWLSPVPVTAAELNVVETYLGALIDELFTRSARR